MKKIEDFPRISRFKISSLQLPAMARSSSKKNANSGGIPSVSGSGAGGLGNFFRSLPIIGLSITKFHPGATSPHHGN